MIESGMAGQDILDYDQHWANSLETYKNHPTSRHRRRFVMQSLRKIDVSQDAFVFDYGCGTGLLLGEIRQRFGIPDSQLGGCDTSQEAIRAARESFQSPAFYDHAYPTIERSIDIAITTEVIEHTDRYEEILRWLRDNLRNGGTLIVTTPGGKMDPPDVYYGHVQHFRLDELRKLLERLGFSLIVARYWGFPFFTLQKLITRKFFDKVNESYMGGALTLKKRLIFTLAYYLYMAHDFIPYGPQIFILAQKAGAEATFSPPARPGAHRENDDRS